MEKKDLSKDKVSDILEGLKNRKNIKGADAGLKKDDDYIPENDIIIDDDEIIDDEEIIINDDIILTHNP